ncbi:DUF378 domain-containing protein [Candidatus Wolfebacteria bacterium]|nr:MAG: DUF378 domain-containing protein [Candidatus Wolfebacteria bacterium]
MKGLHCITFLLLILGGINYGLILLDWWNLTDFLGGAGSTWGDVFYGAVGISALYELAKHKANCKACKAK